MKSEKLMQFQIIILYIYKQSYEETAHFEQFWCNPTLKCCKNILLGTLGFCAGIPCRKQISTHGFLVGNEFLCMDSLQETKFHAWIPCRK